ncbi:amidohydrolase family protein [Pendulispora rubella]|uniref:Amidohydrolase family protein n=1 Tax=Pendulispora rubella TaxID=2741070 RepID=A0ABZ2L517_9BACT
MSIRSVFFRAAAVILGMGCVSSQPSAGNGSSSETRWYLTNVTVLDGTGAAPRAGMTIVISAQRIVDIVPSDGRPPTSDGTVVDGHGRFVMAGLWDSHVHALNNDADVQLYIAMGVTGVRYMWGFPEMHVWRSEIDAGKRLGPRSLIASPIFDGVPVFHTGSVGISNEAEARTAVRQAKSEGADFIKVYSFLTPANYSAISDEASKLGLPVAGHIPDLVPAGTASAAGLRTAEHLYGIPEATSSREADARGLLAAALEDWSKLASPTPAERAAFLRRREAATLLAARSYDESKASALFQQLKDNGTWQTPTLTVLRATGLLDGKVGDANGLRYVPPRLLAFWEGFIANFRASHGEQGVAEAKELYELQLRLTGAMHRAGVGLLAGTDVVNPYCIAGFGLHDELELLVQAGLTPMAALQTATVNPARAFGLSDSMGTVTAGKVADFVVLDANPLDDIRNTRSIDAVVVRGRLISHEERQKILADVEARVHAPADAGTSPQEHEGP